jgi:hypothetical protein
MKLYTCSKCGNYLYFENTTCLKCGHQLGFDPEFLQLITLVETKSGVFSDIKNKKQRYRFCGNQQYNVCNWLVPENQEEPLCRACVLNRTIPPLTDENLALWRRIEIAKHRLIYSLLRLHLPVEPKVEGTGPGLAFDFLTTLTPDDVVMTGHFDGLITLNIAEADEAQRVKNKLDLGEKYRTLLGHFRHEIGHYYWDLRLKDNRDVASFRQTFGDESESYADALKAYYEKGAPADWMEHFISPYASAHPWEDWAESWSHYLHMLDTLETAYYFGITVDPVKSGSVDLSVNIDKDPYAIKDFNTIFNMWLPITFAVNSLNRSMGHPDFYPFIMAPTVLQKMDYIHNLRKSIK